MQSRIPLSICVLVCGAGAAAALCGCAREQAIPTPAPLVQLTTVVRYRPDLTDTFRYSGNVTPNSQVAVTFKSGGYVQSVLQVSSPGGVRPVQGGDAVVQGQTLAQVRRADYEVKVREAQAQLDAQVSGRRQAGLKVYEAQSGVEGARQAVDAASAARAGAEAQRDEARSGLNIARAQLSEVQAGRSGAEAQTAQAQAGFDKATTDYERARRLYEDRALTKPEYDSAKTQLDVTRAQLNASHDQVRAMEAKELGAQGQIRSLEAKVAGAASQIRAAYANLGAARARLRGAGTLTAQANESTRTANSGVKGAGAQVAEARLPLRDSQLISPLTGVMVKRMVEAGSLVAQGTPGFVVADVRQVKVVFGVPDIDLPQLHRQQIVSVRVEARPEHLFQGRITSLSPAADPKSRLFDVEVTVDNPGGLLQMGMIATLRPRPNRAAPATPVAPLSAVVRSRHSASRYAVVVVVKEGSRLTARYRDVKLGQTFGNSVAVIGGLKPGEQIVETSAALLTDGQTVRIDAP